LLILPDREKFEPGITNEKSRPRSKPASFVRRGYRLLSKVETLEEEHGDAILSETISGCDDSH
jgi:hypothetical protein